MAAVVSSSALEAVAGGVIAAAGTVLGIYYTQRNRRHDRVEDRATRAAQAAVADSKNALDAWIAISAAHSAQIASLTARCDVIQARVDECENVTVPALEATIAEQKAMLAQLEEHQRWAAEITPRVDRLELDQHQQKDPP